MPRKPRVWFREQDGFHYTTLRGEQIKLARDPKEAEKAFHLLLSRDAGPEEKVKGRPTFKKVADTFLEYSHEECSAETFKVRKALLQSFCDHVKGRRVPDLRGEHVTSWFKANPAWGKSYRALAVQVLKSSLNHAVNQGMISASPLAKFKRGGFARRERLVTPEERRRIEERVKGSRFADFLFALQQTGARPFAEVAKITADMIDWERETITFTEHKTKKHGKRRTVYLPKPLVETLRRLAAEHPTGPLFRTRKGDAWSASSAHAWTEVFAKDLGIKGVTTYAWRHTYICDAIERGIPLVVIAELVGNSPQVILKHYSHMEQKRDMLKEAAARAVS